MLKYSSDMPNNSDHPNNLSSGIFRLVRNDDKKESSYHPKMARPARRPTTKTAEPDWYLVEWMDTLRVNQADVAREAGWNPSRMNDIYHGKTDYRRELVNLLANILHIRPFELLMHPDEAMAMRQFRQDALRVADTASRFNAEPVNAASAGKD